MLYFILVIIAWWYTRKLLSNENSWALKNRLFNWQYIWILDCNQPHVVRMIKQPDGCWYGRLLQRTLIIDTEGNFTGGYDVTKGQLLTDGIRKMTKKDTVSEYRPSSKYRPSKDNVVNFTNYKNKG